MSRWVEWVEPFGPNNEPVYCRVPEKTAISFVKHKNKDKGCYLTDEQAFDEFVVVNWGVILELPDDNSD